MNRVCEKEGSTGSTITRPLILCENLLRSQRTRRVSLKDDVANLGGYKLFPHTRLLCSISAVVLLVFKRSRPIEFEFKFCTASQIGTTIIAMSDSKSSSSWSVGSSYEDLPLDLVPKVRLRLSNLFQVNVILNPPLSLSSGSILSLLCPRFSSSAIPRISSPLPQTNRLPPSRQHRCHLCQRQSRFG